MIRKFEHNDIEAVMDIWLTTNIEAHHFIPKCYWENNYSMVKELLPKAEVYVYETKNDLAAFVGVDNGYIAGIFVRNTMRSKGIGKQLLDYCKENYDSLRLSVYKKNEGAINFYTREGFHINDKQVDENTKEEEYIMEWCCGQ